MLAGTSDNVNKVTGGLVIQDSEGNQFVWVPVGDVKNTDGTTTEITLGRYTFDTTNGTKKLEQNSEKYTEIVAVNGYNGNSYQELTSDSDNTSAKNLKDFIDKTKAAGGYYLARYETSQGKDGKADSQANKVPWGTITQQASSTEAIKMYDANEYVESDLVNSYSWDTAIVFIQQYSGNSNYANKPSINTNGVINTGEAGDMVCNINDMASNCFEWSTEHSTSGNSLVCRGGTCTDQSFKSSTRAYATNASALASMSLRVILYVN